MPKAAHSKVCIWIFWDHFHHFLLALIFPLRCLGILTLFGCSQVRDTQDFHQQVDVLCSSSLI